MCLFRSSMKHCSSIETDFFPFALSSIRRTKMSWTLDPTLELKLCVFYSGYGDWITATDLAVVLTNVLLLLFSSFSCPSLIKLLDVIPAEISPLSVTQTTVSNRPHPTPPHPHNATYTPASLSSSSARSPPPHPLCPSAAGETVCQSLSLW